MHRPPPLVYLPKARHTGPEFLRPHPESRRDFNLAFESQFRSWPETDGHVRLANGAEPTGQGLPELCGHERVAHSGRARSQMLEAIIAHRRRLLAVPPVPLGLEFWGECARRQQSNAAAQATRPTRLCVRDSRWQL